jgi:hypothetical protein
MAQKMIAAWHEHCESAAILLAAAAVLQAIEPDTGEIDGPLTNLVTALTAGADPRRP